MNKFFINYNNKTFIIKDNTNNGEVCSKTLFKYYQEGDKIWGEYYGGSIINGFIIGQVFNNGNIYFYYQHINNDNDIRIGKCDSKPELLENGLLRMYESWQWLNGDKSAGNSILEEIKER